LQYFFDLVIKSKEIILNFITIGAISGCVVVILGAFGAHSLKDVLDSYSKSLYEKAVLYQMFHTLGILIIAIIEKALPEVQLQLVSWAFLLGIIFFSGSLYILAITGAKWLGMITPIGGVLFIYGWVVLLYKIY